MSLLDRAQVKREIFDPKNAAHIASFKVFMRTGNWGAVQFFHEAPYEEVPMTVLMKYASHMLKIERESAIERSARLSTRDLIQIAKSETRQEKLARFSNAEKLIAAAVA